MSIRSVPESPVRENRHYDEGVLRAHMGELRFQAWQERDPEKRVRLEAVIRALDKRLDSRTKLSALGPAIRGAVAQGTAEVQRRRTFGQRLKKIFCGCLPKNRVSPLSRSTANLDLNRVLPS